MTSEINHTINKGNIYYYGLRNILGSELLRKDIKCKIYTILIGLEVLYGCETWTLTKTKEGELGWYKKGFKGNLRPKICQWGTENKV
jgi:hypothetical protein